MSTNAEETKDSAENSFEETIGNLGAKAEALWKQLQEKTGFSDEKIENLKQKAATKIDELKAEMDTWDDEAKVKWEELKTSAGSWWEKIKDEMDGDDVSNKKDATKTS